MKTWFLVLCFTLVLFSTALPLCKAGGGTGDTQDSSQHEFGTMMTFLVDLRALGSWISAAFL